MLADKLLEQVFLVTNIKMINEGLQKDSSTLCSYKFNSTNISQVFPYFWLVIEINLKFPLFPENKMLRQDYFLQWFSTRGSFAPQGSQYYLKCLFLRTRRSRMLLTYSEQSKRRLLGTLQCTGQLSRTKDYLTQNVNSTTAEKL